MTGESEEVITEYEFDWGAQFLEVRSNQVREVHIRICGPKAIALMAFMRRRRGITSDQDLIRLALCELAIHTLKRRGADSKLVRMAH